MWYARGSFGFSSGDGSELMCGMLCGDDCALKCDMQWEMAVG